MMLLGAGAGAYGAPPIPAPAPALHLPGELDVDHVAGPLWIGSAVPLGPVLHQAGFDVVVLASSWQPRSHELPGVFVLHAPFVDQVPATNDDVRTAMAAAQHIRTLIAKTPDLRILVTCMAGLNRSGLIVALCLHLLYGWDADHAIRVLRAARPGALSNPDFVRYLEWVAPARR